jgi:hypothetical protein
MTRETGEFAWITRNQVRDRHCRRHASCDVPRHRRAPAGFGARNSDVRGPFLPFDCGCDDASDFVDATSRLTEIKARELGVSP